MDRVEDWIGDFYVKHTVRCHREDWPAPGSEDESTTLDTWRHAFVTRGVEHRFADVASLDMAGDPPRFLSDHLPTIVRLAADLRRRDDATPQADPLTSLDAAKAASKDCPDCLGTGGAVRYVHPEIHGKVKTSGGHVAPVGMAVTYPCSCPLGRFVARGLQPEGSARPVLTVDQYPSLRMGRARWSDAPDSQYRHRPSHWAAESGMPAHAGECLDLDGLRRLVATTAAPGGAIYRGTRHEPRHGDARALPGDAVPARSELADALDDPVVRRELARPAPPPALTIPEDDAPSGWF